MGRVVNLFFIFLVLIFSQVPGLVYGAIPPEERAALIAFYEAACGDNWLKNSGWKEGELEFDGFAPVGSENNWYGITVSDNHVTEIHIRSRFMKPGEFSASISPELGNLSNLIELELGIYKLSGGIPAELGKLSNLESLHVFFSEVSGSIPAELGNLSKLQFLYLIHNRLSGSIPPELGNLSNLNVLDLSNNQLSGSIPPEIGNLSNLEALSIYGNQLSGSIPPEIGNLYNLESLILDKNQLSGNIPAELGNLSNLKVINLSDNQLSGAIPAELGNLNNLTDLILDNNRLSGSIPPELGNLSNLRHLWLFINRLSGSLPYELGYLNNLAHLRLYSNQLTGPMPLNLTSLSTLFVEIDYNALYTDDDILRSRLTRITPRWAKTQTKAPDKVSAAALSASSIKVSWKPIVYSDDPGGYMVYYSESPRGPWMFAGITPDKLSGSYVVKDLKPGKKYYFVVQTQTRPHPKNKNELVSDFSKDAFAITKTGAN